MTVIVSDLMEQIQNPVAVKLPVGNVSGKLRRRTAMAKLPKLKAGDTISLMQLPEQAYLHSLKIAVDNLGKTGACDIGLFTKDAGVADGVISGLVMNGKATPFTELRFGKFGIDTLKSKNWQLAGVTTCPDSPVDVIATITQDTELAGSMVLVAEYAID